MSEALEVRLVEKIGSIPEATWNGLLGERASPFLEWAWLEALERAGCVGADKGWLPQHVTLYRDGKLIAAAPAYLKGNSEGEFVFDWQWASFAEQKLGIDYYPKLVVAVPFTPVTGERILVAPGEDRAALTEMLGVAVTKIVQQLGLSSGHVLFPREEEADALVRAGLVRRLGVQFHWKNQDFATFDDFLSSMGSKKKHQIKRERREVKAQGIVIETRRGSDLDEETLAAAYRFYLATVDKFVWGRRYLNEEFFRLIAERWADDRLEVVVAKRNGVLVGGAVNVHKDDRLYGRYWGADEDVKFLHFDVCYYHSIEECIARKDAVFEPGAGGEHKARRGFAPTKTWSAHYLRDPRMRRVIADVCAREAAHVERMVETGEEE
ncbi:MAG: N-acetyltransferase [Myxococcales bacterium]|nr:N-acetyltransferase [Myxococcales bacterium]